MQDSPKKRSFIPLHQILFRFLIYAIGGAFAIANGIDAFSSAIDFITPSLRLFGSAILVIGWIGVQLALRYRPLSWVVSSGQTIRIRSLGPKINLGLLGVLLLFWIPVFLQLINISSNDTKRVTILADEDWQKSGIRVEEGQQVTISHISGSWTVNENNPGSIDPYTDSAGNPDILFEAYVSNAPLGALIGKIEDTQPFLVSRYREIKAHTTGELFFRINDGICIGCQSAYSDNGGEVTVEIRLGKK